jgi:hypothetical protein
MRVRQCDGPATREDVAAASVAVMESSLGATVREHPVASLTMVGCPSSSPVPRSAGPTTPAPASRRARDRRRRRREDTRRLHRLCADLGIELTGRVVSYFEGNEAQRTRRCSTPCGPASASSW